MSIFKPIPNTITHLVFSPTPHLLSLKSHTYQLEKLAMYKMYKKDTRCLGSPPKRKGKKPNKTHDLVSNPPPLGLVSIKRERSHSYNTFWPFSPFSLNWRSNFLVPPLCQWYHQNFLQSTTPWIKPKIRNSGESESARAVRCFASYLEHWWMSSAILLASIDAPSNPRFVNPTAYSPHSPFQPLGNGLRGNPSFSENISLSYRDNQRQ